MALIYRHRCNHNANLKEILYEKKQSQINILKEQENGIKDLITNYLSSLDKSLNHDQIMTGNDLERLKKEGRVKEVKKVKPGEKLWQSLENKGLAEKLETGQYKFINAEVAALEGKPTTDTKADIEKRKKEEVEIIRQ